MKKSLQNLSNVTVKGIAAISTLFWSCFFVYLFVLRFDPNEAQGSPIQEDTKGFIILLLVVIGIIIASVDTLFGKYFLMKTFRKNLQNK